jgi:gliding motility-associated-like protein
VTGSTYIGASAGNYVVSATDGVCYATAQYTLNQPSPLTATTSHTDAPCGANGTATIAISGGTPPYSNVNWAGTAGYTASLPPGTWIANFQDANGCSALLQYTETIAALPCGISSNVSKTNVTCYGANTGSITLTVNSTTPPVNINWSNGGSGSTISNLLAGTYTYTVTDATPSHTFSGSITITQPGAAMVASVSTIGITCAGTNSGETIASVISGGNSPYTYAWSNGVGNNPHLVNLAPGNYTVTATDNIGCTATATGIVSGVPSLNLTVAVTPDTCYHSSKGSAIAQVTGGVSPYSYYWSNFLTNDTNSSLIAGTYNVTVTDGNGCTISGSGTVNGPPPLTTNYTLQHITCKGATTGSFTTVSGGGTSPLTYTWNPSNLTGANQSNLAAGIYAYTVSDANGCYLQRQDTIREPATALAATSTHTNVSCYGANNGTITVNISGGTPPYTYSGNTVPAGVTTIPNLPPNIYTAAISDSNGCSVTLNDTISQPGQQSLTVDSTDNPCAGALQGSVTANFINATGTVTYNWSPGGIQLATVNNLASGVYNVTATDANSCSLTGTTTINEPPAPIMTVSASNAACFGGNGSATANPAGNGPFNYIWSNNAGGNTATVTPPAGYYTVSASDVNGCNQTASFTINEPAQLLSSETHTNNLCFGTSVGTATITLSGGTGAYSYQWTQNVSNTNTASNLAAGSYSVTGTDANNCSVVQSVVITEPAQVDVTASATDVLCFGGNFGSITANATGGTNPFSYSATSDGTTFLQSSSGQFTNQMAATYTVYATDGNQCIDSTTVTVNEPTQLVATSTGVDVTCYQYTDGVITVTAVGGIPAYNFTFSNGEQNNTGVVNNLTPGTYDVTITDANNCTANQTVIILEPLPVIISTTPSVTEVKLGESLALVTTTNHSGTTTYNWQPSFGLTCYDCANPVFNGVYNATYTVTATTDKGCTGSDEVTVTVIPNYDVFVPNAFTPNGDGNNDTWKFFGNLSGVKQMNIKVFNRIGEKVFESNDINFEWDGNYSGKSAPNGVYTYTATFVWLNNHSDDRYKGTVTVLR